MSNSIYYGRRWRVLVKNGVDTVLDVSDLRVVFDIKKALIGERYGEISIYNLNVKTENQIIKEGLEVIIEAGYEGDGNYGIIFKGNIIQPLQYKENATTYVLKLVCLGDDDFRNFGIVNFSMQKGQNARDIVEGISQNSSVSGSLGKISDDFYSTPQTIRGKSFFGLSKDYLRQLAQSHNATYFNDDGKINLIKLSDGDPNTAIELNSQSGLIGFPEQIDFGVNVKSLLNPNLRLDSWIKLNNQDIKLGQYNIGNPFLQPLDFDGLYRIIDINYHGDTRGNDWYADMITVSQSGLVPSMLASPDQFGW